jgi:hypothetical protein
MFTLVLGLSLLSVFLDLILLASLVSITEAEAFPAFPFAVAGAGALLYFGFGVDVLTALKSVEFSTYLFSVLGYVAVGSLWSVFKWWRYSVSSADAIAAGWAKFKDSENRSFSKAEADTSILKPSGALLAKFHASAVYNPLWRDGISLSNGNNWKIVNWAVLWPTSVVWTALRGVTVDLGRAILRAFGRVYDGITKSALSNLD